MTILISLRPDDRRLAAERTLSAEPLRVGIWPTLPTYPGQTGFDATKGPGGRLVPGRPHARDTDYAAWQGTSMTSPHVAGAAAKRWSASPAIADPGVARLDQGINNLSVDPPVGRA